MAETSYQDSAYNSSHIEPQPRKAAKTLAQRLLSAGQQMFPRVKRATHLSTRVGMTSPSEWNQDREVTPDMPCFWNEKVMEGVTENIWARVYLILSAMAKMVVLVVTVVVFITALLELVITSGESNPLFFLKGYFLFVFIPAGIIWGQFELYNRGYWKPKLLNKFLDARVVFELNRQTGMVTLFKGNGKVRYSHPFIEFDCILSTTPSQQGMMNYSLLLAHRYNGSMHGVPIGMLLTPNETVAEYQRYWNMVQNYMDVSQPLPDILLLEEAREKDPTTVEFDKQTGRNPRYWRDMTDEEYASAITDIEYNQSRKSDSGMEIDLFN
jgi:hypothetical protein